MHQQKPFHYTSQQILCWQASPFTCVLSKHLIHQGRIRSEEKARAVRLGLDKICDLTDTIVDVRFGDSDLDTYKYEPMDNLLDCWEKENNDKNGKQYHEQWIFPSILLLSVWHSQEGGSSLTLKFESTHGRKTRGTHFTRTEMDQRPDLNHSCKILLLNDPQILPSQYHAGSGAGLVFGIGPWLGKINCAPE